MRWLTDDRWSFIMHIYGGISRIYVIWYQVQWNGTVIFLHAKMTCHPQSKTLEVTLHSNMERYGNRRRLRKSNRGWIPPPWNEQTWNTEVLYIQRSGMYAGRMTVHTKFLFQSAHTESLVTFFWICSYISVTLWETWTTTLPHVKIASHTHTHTNWWISFTFVPSYILLPNSERS